MKNQNPHKHSERKTGIISILAALFGLAWIIATVMLPSGTIPAQPLFTLIGVVVMVVALTNAVYHFKKSSGKSFHPDEIQGVAEDTTPSEVPDSSSNDTPECGSYAGLGFCPHCGSTAENDGEVCTHCGNRIIGEDEEED